MDGDGTALMVPTLAAGERILPDASDLTAPHQTLPSSSAGQTLKEPGSNSANRAAFADVGAARFDAPLMVQAPVLAVRDSAADRWGFDRHFGAIVSRPNCYRLVDGCRSEAENNAVRGLAR